MAHSDPTDVALCEKAIARVTVGGQPLSAELEICLGLAREEIDRVRHRLPGEVEVLEHAAGFLQGDDPFQPPDGGFNSNGEIAGRWLDV